MEQAKREKNAEDIAFCQRTVDQYKEEIEELILALKPSIEGETTMQYIKKVLESKNIKVTRIATGIPIGTDIEYIDSMTLEFAFEGRKDI